MVTYKRGERSSEQVLCVQMGFGISGSLVASSLIGHYGSLLLVALAFLGLLVVPSRLICWLRMISLIG